MGLKDYVDSQFAMGTWPTLNLTCPRTASDAKGILDSEAIMPSGCHTKMNSLFS